MKKKNKKSRLPFSDILIFLFVLLLPTQLGKHFFLPFSYLSGIRVDYLAPTIYLTDIIIMLLAILNLKYILSFIKQKKILFLLILLSLNILISLYPPLSIYQFLKVVELLVVFVLIKNRALSLKAVSLGFLLGGVLELFLAIIQFIYKHSLQGIFYFFGERYFTLSTPGIAKASLFGIEILRPYGTFSHPNSLAGFYLLIYFFILTDKKIKLPLLIKNSLLLVSSLLILLSFSKLAIITYLMLNLIFLLKSSLKSNCKLCFFSRILTLIAISFIFFQAKTDPLSLEKRYYLTNNALSIIGKNLFFGVGMKNYLIAQNQIPSKFPDLLNQPVHNIFLLSISELGIIVFFLIFFLLSRELKKFFTNHGYIFLVILLTGFFDHYWLTLQQNFILLGVIFGLL